MWIELGHWCPLVVWAAQRGVGPVWVPCVVSLDRSAVGMIFMWLNVNEVCGFAPIFCAGFAIVIRGRGMRVRLR